MTPHQQAEADLDRRRTQHDAEQAAITAGHDDVVDAEIVD